MMNVLIVEDDVIIREGLKAIILNYGYNVFVSSNINETLSNFESHIIDFVFLDIDLDEEKDGIWLAHFINEHYKIPFVFTTGNDDDEVIKKAIGSDPCSYLIKPFSQNDVLVALEIMKKRTAYKKKQQNSEKDFFLELENGLKRIHWNEVYYIENYQELNRCKIHCANASEKINKSFVEIENYFSDDFIQVHDEYIVNLNKVLNINAKLIELVDDFYIPIDEKYRKNISEKIKVFWNGKS